jgi:hypothetical protein
MNGKMKRAKRHNKRFALFHSFAKSRPAGKLLLGSALSSVQAKAISV